MTLRLQGKILRTGKTAAGMVIPDEVVARLGPSRHPAVRVTVGAYTFRPIKAIKGEAARQRRVERAVASLHEDPQAG
jgi:hypothetical protein